MEEQSPFAAAFPASTVYEMIGDVTVPWRYTSVDEEYAALRGTSGLIDLSGAGLIAVDGPGAEGLLSRLFTREIEFLSQETSVMGLFLTEDATPLDVVTISRTDDGFLVETAIGRRTSTLAHLGSFAGPDVTVRELGGELAMLGFEGPASWDVAEALLDEPITGLPFQGVRPVQMDGFDVTVSRTGFTGEFGFKLVGPREHAGTMWSKAAAHAVPTGQEALEIAMIETRQPILHREAMGREATVVRCGFNWLVDFEKEEFLGREALTAQRASGPSTLPVGFVSDAAVIEPGTRVGVGSEAVGEVVHAVHSPGLGTFCGIAHVEADYAASGIVFDVIGTPSTVRTVSAPARIPTSWGELIASQVSQGS